MKERQGLTAQKKGHVICKPKTGVSGEIKPVSLWSQTSSLQDNKEINLCCLSHPIDCILLRQPKQTDTGWTILGIGGRNEKQGYVLYT